MSDVKHAVAGLGFREQVSCQSLHQVLDAAIAAGRHARGGLALQALATAEDKCRHPALLQLATERGLQVQAVPLARLVAQDLPHSVHVPARYGAHSLAEAAALAASGPGAALIVSRRVSDDRHATAAIALNPTEPERT